MQFSVNVVLLEYENIAVVFEHTTSVVLCEHTNGVNSDVGN